MSNENSTTNSPRQYRVKKSNSRYRKFSCITYLKEEQLLVCLAGHLHQIRAYAYAYHDKDTKEDGTLKQPHFHLIIVTHTTCTLSAVRRWFSGYIDSNGEITTTAQACTDIYEMYDYLTHDTIQAKLDGKYQYDKSIVKSSNDGFFKADLESSYDNITLAAEMLMKGVSIHDCGKKFGRDFILHYGDIRHYIEDLRYEKVHGSLYKIDFKGGVNDGKG